MLLYHKDIYKKYFHCVCQQKAFSMSSAVMNMISDIFPFSFYTYFVILCFSNALLGNEQFICNLQLFRLV
jgi:hypothetical protein